MSNNKQTAVEWLEKEFVKLEATIGVYSKMYEIIEQAKEIEKQQIEDAYGVGHNEGCSYMTDGKTEFKDATQYYNETFGGNK